MLTADALAFIVVMQWCADAGRNWGVCALLEHSLPRHWPQIFTKYPTLIAADIYDVSRFNKETPNLCGTVLKYDTNAYRNLNTKCFMERRKYIYNMCILTLSARLITNEIIISYKYV